MTTTPLLYPPACYFSALFTPTLSVKRRKVVFLSTAALETCCRLKVWFSSSDAGQFQLSPSVSPFSWLKLLYLNSLLQPFQTVKRGRGEESHYFPTGLFLPSQHGSLTELQSFALFRAPYFLVLRCLSWPELNFLAFDGQKSSQHPPSGAKQLSHIISHHCGSLKVWSDGNLGLFLHATMHR